MVGHQNIGEKLNVKALATLCQCLQEQAVIRIRTKDVPAFIAAG
jgi:hypothetical protein